MRLVDPEPAAAPGPDAVSTVDALLAQARARGASDLHLDPDAAGGRVRLRLDGLFEQAGRLEGELYRRAVNRLKLLAGAATWREDIPQEGRIAGEGGEARLSVVPTPQGEKVVLRFHRPVDLALDLAGLGFSAPVVAGLARLCAERQGALLVTGPCSSGKSTTLHALARRILAGRGERTHLVTVEDPVECLLPGATQIEVDPARGLSFAAALRALLRQDPEVLLIGEIRDAETARIGIEAAFTGHLVLATMHAGQPGEAVARLIQMGIEPYLVRAALRGVLAQRLVRRRLADGSYRGRLAFGALALPDAQGELGEATVSLAAAGAELVARGLTGAEEVRFALGEEP